MAWLAVRDQVETWLSGASIPFYNTVSEDQAPADDIWMTVMFGSGDGRNITYCRDRIDESVFTVVVYGNPGLGWRPVITAAEDVKNYLLGLSDPLGKIVIDNHSFPLEFEASGDVPWFGVEVLYFFSYFT